MSKDKLNPQARPSTKPVSASECQNPEWKTQSTTPLLKLPVNEYGTIDVIGGVPDGLIHLRESRLGPTCKRLGIEFGKALVGWHQPGCSYKTYPRFSGVVILATDHPRLEAAIKVKAVKRQKGIERLSVLAALFTLNRRAKRCRDLAQTYYNKGMHGFAGKMRDEKTRIYDLKGQALHYLAETGVLTGGTFHCFEFGNWAEVLEGEGYRFHRPCPPKQLVSDAEQMQSLESKPKGAKEPTLEIAFEVVRTFLLDKPRINTYQWRRKVQRSRRC